MVVVVIVVGGAGGGGGVDGGSRSQDWVVLVAVAGAVTVWGTGGGGLTGCWRCSGLVDMKKSWRRCWGLAEGREESWEDGGWPLGALTLTGFGSIG